MAGRPKRRAKREAAGEIVPRGNGSWPAFEKGNEANLRHGAFASLRIGERAEGILVEALESAPVATPADMPMFRLFAAALARFEAATLALARLDEATAPGNEAAVYFSDKASAVERIRQDQSRSITQARRLADDLAFSPRSRAALGLDVVRIEDTLADLAAKGREIRERRGETS